MGPKAVLRFLFFRSFNHGGERMNHSLLKGYKIITFSFCLLAGYKIITYLCCVIKKQIIMPTVLDLFGLKFIIFTADHQPPHCHVRSTNGSAKFEIKDGVRLIESTLKPKELKLAEYVLEENLENIQEAWKKYHGEF
jgi:hypothetical protein